MTKIARSLCPTIAVLIALGGCSPPPGADQAVPDINTPGWTGRTLVPGSGSTIAGNAAATELQQKWGTFGRH